MKLRFAVALLTCVSLTSAVAGAQMSEGERKAAARAAYMEGVALQDKGDPAEALARFEAAQKLYDAPTHLLHIAECQALTGKLVEASETYETLIRTPLGKDAPAAFVQARDQARAEVAQLRPRIPTMRVTVDPDPESLTNLQITMNERRLPTELVDIARPVNPGKYRMSATADGWATPSPVDVEVKERAAESVKLVLRKGATAPVVAAPSATAGEEPTPPATTPPPYEANVKPATESPSKSGLLLGARPLYMIPLGSVSKSLPFRQFARGGPGVGVDVIGRVARMALVGGTLEFAKLGAPSAADLPAGSGGVDFSTTSVYLGVLAGILPNVDRVSFVADAGAGMRFLSQTRRVTGADQDLMLSGLEFRLGAGVSVPAGPLRIVPKAGIALGTLDEASCSLSSAALGTGGAKDCTSGAIGGTFESTLHTVLTLGVGIYYHVDFSKK